MTVIARKLYIVYKIINIEYLYSHPGIGDKLQALIPLVRQSVSSERDQMVIFVKTRTGAEDLLRELKEKVLLPLQVGEGSIGVLHGKLAGETRPLGPKGLEYDRKNVEMRLEVITRLKKKELRVLLATDVFARGIDAPGIDTVINYDLPVDDNTGDIETYFHRIGRCGRKGVSGISITLVQGSQDTQMLEAIKNICQNESPPDWVAKDESGRPVEEAVKEIPHALKDEDKEKFVKDLWTSFLRKRNPGETLASAFEQLAIKSAVPTSGALGDESDVKADIDDDEYHPDDNYDNDATILAVTNETPDIDEYHPNDFKLGEIEVVVPIDQIAQFFQGAVEVVPPPSDGVPAVLPTLPGSAPVASSNIETWESLGLPGHSIRAIESIGDRKGIHGPYEIQKTAIPQVLRGHHVIAQAPTGTGKSLAFVICMLNSVDPTLGHVQAISLSPTKDLVVQTMQDWFEPLIATGQFGDVRAHICMGGWDKPPKAPGGRFIRQHIILGTPDRIRNMIQNKDFDPQHVHTICLDEADELVRGKDAGDKVGSSKEIIKSIKGARKHVGNASPQILCFSATFPAKLVVELTEFIEK